MGTESLTGEYMKRTFILGLAAMASPALAQDAQVASLTAPSTPVATIVSSPASQNILRAGTEVALITREELTTKKKNLRVGQRFQMEVASNITHNGVTVIPSGSPAVGEVTEVRNKGMWGKSGYIGARIVSLRLGDRNVRLSGTFDDKGVTGTGGVVAAIALIPVAGFFTTGTSAFIASGSGVKAFLDEDIAFQTVVAPAPVIEIPVPAQSAAVGQ